MPPYMTIFHVQSGLKYEAFEKGHAHRSSKQKIVWLNWVDLIVSYDFKDVKCLKEKVEILIFKAASNFKVSLIYWSKLLQNVG